jgi:galactokinase
VNLIGEHTDYSGGLALPAAIDRGVTIECIVGGDAIELRSDRHPGVAACAADGSELAPGAPWARYVAAVAAELAEIGREPVGLRGTVVSNLPDGAGLSSSAAIEVATAIALCGAAGLALEPLEVAAACQRAEKRAVGTLGGILDQASSVLGRPGAAILLDCGTLEHRSVPLPRDVALLVIDSGVRRSLEDSEYGRRRLELEAAAAAVGRPVCELTPDEASALADGADLDDVGRRRLRHVVTENERVRAVVRALEAPSGPDLAAVGDLFAAGHASLRDDFEISTPELDLLVELAREHGALAARMTGGGFGGSIVALVERDAAEGVAARVTAAYDARGSGPRASALVCEAAAGAAEISGAAARA